MKKQGSLYTVVSSVKWCEHCGEVWQFIQNRVIIWPAIPLVGITKRIENTYLHKMYKLMFIAMYSQQTKDGNNTKFHWLGKRVNNMWYIYAMEYF